MRHRPGRGWRDGSVGSHFRVQNARLHSWVWRRRITVGDRGLKEGVVEYQQRRHSGEPAAKIAVDQAVAHVLAQLKS